MKTRVGHEDGEHWDTGTLGSCRNATCNLCRWKHRRGDRDREDGIDALVVRQQLDGLPEVLRSARRQHVDRVSDRGFRRQERPEPPLRRVGQRCEL